MTWNLHRSLGREELAQQCFAAAKHDGCDAIGGEGGGQRACSYSARLRACFARDT